MRRFYIFFTENMTYLTMKKNKINILINIYKSKTIIKKNEQFFKLNFPANS